MRETKFIAQKRAQWQNFETMLALKDTDPERLGDLYVQVTDDLSFARTFYPNRSVRVYLNGLAQQLFVKIYKNKPFSLNGFIAFWREELPDLLWHSRKVIGWSFAIFALFFAVGWLSSTLNPDFDKTMLGEQYIQMTKDNIAKGDPMAVYKGDTEIDSFIHICSNNLKVDFLTFVLGLLFGIGALLVMIYNAIMVGSFQHFFYAFGGFQTSLFSIWVHGAFEICAMILSCAAGMELGKGLLFPETYSRLQAFQISAQRGFKILIGVLLLTVIAAFNESFLTRLTDVSLFVRGALIFVSFGFVFFYFIYYPYRRYRAGLVQPPKADNLAADDFSSINWSSIKTNAEILKQGVGLLRENFSAIVTTAFLGAALYTLGELFFVGGNLKGIISFRNWSFFNFGPITSFPINVHWHNMTQFWDFQELPIYFPIASFVFFALITIKVQHLVQLIYDSEGATRNFWRFSIENANILRLSIPIALLTGVLFLKTFGIFLFLVALPIVFIWQFAMLVQNSNPFSALGFSMSLVRHCFFDLMAISGILALIFFIFTFIISTPLADMVINFIQWNLRVQKGDGYVIMRYLVTFAVQFMLAICTSLLIFSMAILTGAFNEITNASSLREQINSLGKQRDLRGVVRE